MVEFLGGHEDMCRRASSVKAVISNGFGRFHLAPLAVEIDRRAGLDAFFAAGWPTGWQAQIARVFASTSTGQRFLDRAEDISDCRIRSFALTEGIWRLALLARRWSPAIYEQIEKLAMRSYANCARDALESLKPNIYHYRSCFGLSSVRFARERGAITLCDHTIAHPRLLEYLINHDGLLPASRGAEHMRPIEQLMEHDIELADHILVNSDFVKATFVHAGIDPERVHVIYLGVDEKFMAGIPQVTLEQLRARRRSLLFAGYWQARKGAWVIHDALADNGTKCWITIAGSIAPEMRSDSKMNRFLCSENVKNVGLLARHALARLMAEHAVFVFPSLCEGSARVIFEALACGCYVITTPNSGSIVEDGVHGRVIRPGDSDALKSAVLWAMNHPEHVERIGLRNAELVRENYRQKHYGDKTMSLYNRLLGTYGS